MFEKEIIFEKILNPKFFFENGHLRKMDVRKKNKFENKHFDRKQILFRKTMITYFKKSDH